MPLITSLCLLAALALQAADVSSPRSGHVEVGGVRLHYLDWGGAGEPIVLVPGGCGTPYVFGDLAPLLTARFRVLGVTPRGCGDSGMAPDGYGVDQQIRELVGFLDALGIERATFAGHSSGGGKVVRLARLFPSRVSRLVSFDIVYTGVPDGFGARMDAAIRATIDPPLRNELSLDAHRLVFQGWELGTWSPALEREFAEQTDVDKDGRLRYRPWPPEWRKAWVEDLRAGRYFETEIVHPALMFVAEDLDLERVRRLPADEQRELRPMAEAVVKARRDQIATYQRNGSHVRVVLMRRASHYLFVDRAREVAAEMIAFPHGPDR